MKRTPLLLALLLGVACGRQAGPAEALPEVSTGQIERIENMASEFISPRHVDVWLPEGYDPGKRYAVLYMHDGQMLFDTAITWNHQAWRVHEVVSDLTARGLIEECIVVGVHNAGPLRGVEYFPQKPFFSLPEELLSQLEQSAREHSETDTPPMPMADDYLRFLVEELKPLIDSRYATHSGPEHTAIMGSSMGALISWYALCEYPEVFGRAGCISTHWPIGAEIEGEPIVHAFFDYLRNHLPPPGRHRLYFDYGTATLDSLYEPYQRQADRIMEQAGYGPDQWITRRFDGAEHNEVSWNARLDIPLEFLLRPGQ
jgi:hypothetical protein